MNDLLNGMLWGTIISVGLGLVGGFLVKGIVNTPIGQQIVSEDPGLSSQIDQLKAKGYI